LSATQLTQINVGGQRYFMVDASNFNTSPPNKAYPMRLTPVCLVITLVMITSAIAATPSERRGRHFAKTHCSKCHSIDRVSQSPRQEAPPFRTLHLRYPVETLAEAFAEGIYTGHPAMPAFELEPDEINDLLSFFKTLEK
jgi:mono/diheme cytochrome c family protein